MNHAILSPSSAHRWLTCTPSARLEQQFGDTESVYAAEGTFAHALAEWLIKHPDQPLPADFTDNSFFSQAMVEFVTMYTDEVKRKTDSDSNLFLEQELDLSEYAPESFGHADAVILNDKTLDVIDLKYGAGVPVSAVNNPQLRLYALGVYSEWAFLYDFDSVTMTIVQPRNGGISSETLSVDDLLRWGDTVKPLAKLAFDGKGDFKPGNHCRFCKAADKCRALADYHLACVNDDFDSPDLLDDDEISEILSRADSVIKWLESVKAYALKEALNNGKKWHGFKLVEGRSNRKIVDAEGAARLLKDSGADDSDIWKTRELLTLTALEKNFGKKRLADLLGDLIHKPPGAPTLVDDSDPRPEFNSAVNDFA